MGKHCCRNCGIAICIGLTIIIVTACLTFAAYFFILSNEHFCMSPECIKSSAEINDYIDDSVNPCEDFHQFACGKFVQNARENPYEMEESRVTNHLNDFVTQAPNDDDLEPVAMQKKYFRACMDLERIDADKNRMFLRLIDYLGGSPILKKHVRIEKEFDWMKMMIKCRKLGLPFNWFLDIKLNEIDEDYIMISYPENCNAVENNTSHEYLTMMVDVVVNLFGFKHVTMSELTQVFNFEIELAKICENSKNDETTYGTIKDLDLLWPRIGWTDFISILTGWKKWNDSLKVAYNIDFYIMKLENLLFITPKSVQANYVIWRLIKYFAPYLSKPIREAYSNYLVKTTGTETERLDFCLQDTRSRFTYVSEVAYIRKHVTPELSEAVGEMVSLVKEEYVSRIEKFDFMDDDSKNFYLDLYKETVEDVGGQEEIHSDDFFDMALHLEGLDFDTDNIIQMITEKMRVYFDSSFSNVGHYETEPHQMLMRQGNLQFSLLFLHDTNKLLLPVTMLQNFFYDLHRPNYLNYGSLATLISLKLASAFGIAGNGSEEIMEIFDDIRQCIINDFAKLYPESTNISEHFTENPIDIFARDVAYSAYQKWVRLYRDEETLPGFQFTPNQLFWIKSSMMWCYDHPMDVANKIDDEEMAVYKFGIIGSLRHLPTFGVDFKCPLGSFMNPPEKCNLL